MSAMSINVGPVHPGTHGALRLVVDVDGDAVRRVEPHIGFLHRGVEKLMETRLYMQNIPYTEKLDYAAPLSWDDLYVSAVEQAMGIAVKERAQYLRVILLEFQRIASHMLWLGTFADDLGQLHTMSMWTLRDRARIMKLMQDVSGGRMSHLNLRLGGFKSALPEDFEKRAYDLTDHLEASVLRYPEMLDDNPVFMERTKGIGVLEKADAIEYGVAGPVLRASGIEEDARKSSPYYVYDKIIFNVPTGSHGDCFDRYRVRYEEMLESIKIIRQALDAMPKRGDLIGAPIKLAGPDAKPDPVVALRELPRGEGMIYMIPDKQRPYRVSLRSPAFVNLAALPKMAEGCTFADLFSILGSIDIIVAELDR
jgi:NADH-quinone oxidoreductase subunit D